MELKIVHCADLHIGASFSSLPSNLAGVRKEELRLALADIVSFCKNREVDALLICGDLFDSPTPTKKDSEFVRKELSNLAPIPVYIVCGNHDYMCGGSPFSKEGYFSSNVHIFPAFDYVFDFPEKNAAFYGKSYSGSVITPSFDNISPDKNKLNIMCLHGDITANSDYNIISKETLSAPHINYAAFGHIHDTYEFSVENTKCAYSGTPEPHRFNDDSSTGFIYAQITPQETKVTPVSFSKRRYHNISLDVSGYAPGEIIEKIKCEITDSDIYRITLTGEQCESDMLDTDFIQENVSRYAFYIEIYDNTTICYDFDEIEKEESLRGEFLRELRKLSSSEEEYIMSAKAGLDALSGNIPLSEVHYAD